VCVLSLALLAPCLLWHRGLLLSVDATRLRIVSQNRLPKWGGRHT
jgi:hypothetical protein